MTEDKTSESPVTAITEKTAVPLVWVFTLAGTAAFFVSSAIAVSIFISKIDSMTANNSDVLILHESKINKLNDNMGHLFKDIYLQQQEIDRRLSRIEGKLGVGK